MSEKERNIRKDEKERNIRKDEGEDVEGHIFKQSHKPSHKP